MTEKEIIAYRNRLEEPTSPKWKNQGYARVAIYKALPINFFSFDEKAMLEPNIEYIEFKKQLIVEGEAVYYAWTYADVVYY